MTKTIVVCGFGPGISSAVAERFGKEGFNVALVARNAERLQSGVKALEAKGIRAGTFPADLSDAASVKAMIAAVQSKLGAITAIHWNAYAASAGDLTTADASALKAVFDVPVVGLVIAVQEALPSLRKQENAAILVTNGGLGFFDSQIDAMAVQWGAMGLAVANSAKHKVVRLLSEKLKSDNIYVGEVAVLGAVKGTAWDQGNATIEPSAVANKFWELYTTRKQLTTNCG